MTERTDHAAGARAHASTLSSAQEGIWLFEQLNPGTSVFTLAHFGRFSGPLDRAVLDRSFASLTARHKSLRSTFESGPHGPRRVARDDPIHVVWEDLRDAGDPVETAVHVAAAAAAAPFYLEHGPLAGLTVYQVAVDDYFVLLRAHHLVCDGASLDIAMHELASLYRAGVDAADAADAAEGSEERSEPVAERDLAYWCDLLADSAPAGPPSNGAAARGFSASTAEIEVPANVVDGMAELADAEGVTRFVIMMAALDWVLSIWSGRQRFTVGCAVTGRTRADRRRAVGLFARTLALPTDLTGAPTIRELLGRVRASTFAAFRHQSCPYEQVVKVLRPEQPLFEALLVMHTYPRDELPFADGVLESVPFPRAEVRHPVELHVWPWQDGLRIEAEFNRDLLDHLVVESLLGHLVQALRSMTTAPDRPLSEVDLLSGAERHRLVDTWGSGAQLAGDGKCLTDSFTRQVALTPAAVAVEAADATLTYDELDRWANRLAHRLRTAGVAAEDVIGVRMSRSSWLLVALLGVLKAGAAYLPIDPAYPAERIDFMTADAGARLVLGDEDVTSDALDRYPAGPVAVGALPDNLAYLIYTSGSTGRPKGVAITHRNASAMVDWAQECFDTDDTRRVLATTSVCFDLSVFECFVPLSRGHTVVFADTDAVRALTAGQHHDVTLLNTVPSVLDELLAAGALPATLRAVNLAGEPLSHRLVAAVQAQDPAIRVRNLYGPSETTTYSTGTLVTAADDPPPIGQPLTGERVYVVDGALRLVPPGAVGELCIGGVGVTRGYHGRPGRTAESFVPDPFRPGGHRLYRTGDLVRYRPDGQLSFVGRTDTQVKVRGFRVELGEIETCLSRCSGVRRSAVVVRGAALVGYVTGDVDAETVLAFARERLPAFMVPGDVLVIDALPETPNGKIDRSALPEPMCARSDAGPSSARTGVEEVVAAVWAQVLGLGSLGVDDDFFRLGGHSLAAARVASRLRETLDVDVSMRLLFEHPTVRTLTAALTTRARDARTAPAPVPRDSVPASFAQERLWFLSTVDDDAHRAYLMQGALELTGPLDGDRLVRALRAVVDRHEPLRTGLVYRAGQLQQHILPSCDLVVVRVTLAGAAELDGLVAAERRPFDLDVPPLFRATLAKLAPDTHVLLLTAHHAICDGWSLSVLFEELSTLYQIDDPEALPALRVQHADFAGWQRASQAEIAADIAYWRTQLAGLEPIDLPTDRPRPVHQTYRGDRVPLRLPSDLVAALDELALSAGATLFMVLLAGFQSVLSGWSGRVDFGVGTPVAGRGNSDLEHAIGLFIETVVLRADLSGEPTFRELVRRVRATSLAAFSRSDVPFERVVAEADAAADSRTPLFQVFFALQNTPRWRLDFADVAATVTEPPSKTAKFDLWLSVTPVEDGAEGWLEYNSDLFDRATAGRLVTHLCTLLRAAVAQPDRRVSELDIMSAAERQALLHDWGTGPAIGDIDRSLPVLIGEQVDRAPQAQAVVAIDRVLTYGELNRRSNQLAHRLRDSGIGPEDVVAVRMSRSSGLMIALLGVLKAGAAYLPLDMTQPTERTGFVLTDSGAVLVVDDEYVASTVDEPTDPIGVDVHPDNLAYLIYTSGSTGTPKGVAVTHRSLTAFLTALASEVPLSAADTVAAITTVSFDIAAVELFFPLCHGAVVALLDNEVAADPWTLGRRLDEVGATVVQATPTTWRMLLGTPWRPAGIRCLCGGEALPPDLANELLATGVEVHHVYGPTETTIWSTHGLLGHADSISLGRPLAGEHIVLLNPAGRQVPTGAVGELCVGGVGLARGYHARPGLTADHFVPDPSSSEGARLYRTGDLARFNGDGVLGFLGRTDAQVKVRGFRVEPGEVESCLCRLAGVEQSAVIARGDQLLGYVVGTVDPHQAQDWVRDHLPHYMVPSVITVLDQLPRTPNGKLDRAALPDPVPPKPANPTGAPFRSADEKMIASVWGQVLGLDAVGRDDDFFGLGGHSVAAARAATQLHEVLDVDVPVRLVFDHPTVAGLAAALRDRPNDGSDRIPHADRPAGDDGVVRLPASYAQERVWLAAQLDPAANTAYTVQAAWRLDGEVDADRLERALCEIVRRHEPLRTGFENANGLITQRILSDVDFRLTRSAVAGIEGVAELATADGVPFDLERPPLLRATLARSGPDQSVLLLTAHHLVCDGWSLPAFVAELSTLYSATGVPPAPVIQHADFAQWQRAHADRHLEYWRHQLTGLLPLDLPTDRPRRPKRGYASGVERTQLAATTMSSIRSFAAASGATPFMTLLAAFLVLAHRHSGQDDIAVGVPTAGRDRPDFDRAIGLFVTVSVIRASIAPKDTVRDVVDRTRRILVDALAHQDCPFERVASELEASGRIPFPQVMFNYLDLPVTSPVLAGVTATPLSTPRLATKFDLDVYLSDRTDGGLDLLVEYDRDLFEPATIRQLVADFETLLRQLPAGADREIAELTLRTPPEPGPEPADPLFPIEQSIIDRFRQVVADHGERTAVWTPTRAFSYSELADRARSVAAAVAMPTAGRIGILCTPGADMPAALLGVLAAGHAYVPLDPADPPARQAQRAREARLDAVVIDHVDRPTPPGLPVVVLDQLEAVAAQLSGGHPDDIAYLLHTSGSEGTPKGVLQNHRNVLHHVRNYVAALGIGPDDRLTQLSSITFDAAVLDIFGALLTGARLCPMDVRDDGAATIAQFLGEAGVTVYHSTPTVFRYLLRDGNDAWPTVPVRSVVLGGEETRPADVRLFADGFDAGCTLWNLFGATECTLAALHRVDRADQLRAAVPIGTAVPGVEIGLTGPDGRPTEPFGQLACRGPQVAVGYWQGGSASPACRGDVARRRPDGTLEFIGRSTDLVNLRGRRVAPAEVEAHLRTGKGIVDVGVGIRADPSGEDHLVAYVVAARDIDPDALRAELRNELPAHLVPDRVLPVSDLPRTRTGKLDRSRLPEPDWTGGRSSEPPSSELERGIAAIWRAALGRDEIGRHDDFFELGGHSLTATAVVSGITESLHLPATLRTLFDHPTVAQLAEALRGQQASRGSTPAITRRRRVPYRVAMAEGETR
ncbi:amino acid adenylation domain-containing protein [Kutzneria sp. NPDC052558]|uniref:amino acid adenylation domain-containing protein n=1 Tax=Kutzneria sp. NPDC052558 TaxID=3364121 RepID=UPI0037C76EF8